LKGLAFALKRRARASARLAFAPTRARRRGRGDRRAIEKSFQSLVGITTLARARTLEKVVQDIRGMTNPNLQPGYCQPSLIGVESSQPKQAESTRVVRQLVAEQKIYLRGGVPARRTPAPLNSPPAFCRDAPATRLNAGEDGQPAF
ncbi:MAG TPA: hypothetical protein VEB64_02730, partial [Azospirillaceae bacterium]|nr:hypothetical protein [Azospirillaceae bacterium]